MPRRLGRQPVHFRHKESGLERINRNFEPSFVRFLSKHPFSRPFHRIPRCIDLRLVGNHSKRECYVFLDYEPIINLRLGLCSQIRCLKRGKSVGMTVPVLLPLAT